MSNPGNAKTPANFAASPWSRPCFIALLLLLVWPFLHRGLVAAFDIEPWNFAGWAMYAVPRKQTFTYIEVEHPDVGAKYIDPQALPRALRIQFTDYADCVNAFGTFCRPTNFAAAFKDRYDIDYPFSIVTESYKLDWRSSRVKKQIFSRQFGNLPAAQ